MEQQTHTKVIEILVGIPCSGKSSYSIDQTRWLNIERVSRDDIREYEIFNQPYKFSKNNENKVSEILNQELQKHLLSRFTDTVILDNTHCKESYIDKIISNNLTFIIVVKFFDISLCKAHYRNIVRYFKTGKWIPINVMNSMYKNYNKINKKKYEKYNI